MVEQPDRRIVPNKNTQMDFVLFLREVFIRGSFLMMSLIFIVLLPFHSSQ